VDQAQTTKKSNPVPFEFQGMARKLRANLAAKEPIVDSLLTAFTPLRGRLLRHPKRPLRPSSLVDVRRAWLSLPNYGSLARTVHIEDPRYPTFHELRCGATRYSGPGWERATDGS
jgi:hypothetical protein